MNDFTLFFMYDMVWVTLLAIIYATYALLSKPKGDKAVRLTIGCLVVRLCPLSQKQALKAYRIGVGCTLLCILWHCSSVARHVEYVAFLSHTP